MTISEFFKEYGSTITWILCGLIILYAYIYYPEFRPIAIWAFSITIASLIAFIIVFCPLIIIISVFAVVMFAGDIIGKVRRICK